MVWVPQPRVAMSSDGGKEVERETRAVTRVHRRSLQRLHHGGGHRSSRQRQERTRRGRRSCRVSIQGGWDTCRGAGTNAGRLGHIQGGWDTYVREGWSGWWGGVGWLAQLEAMRTALQQRGRQHGDLDGTVCAAKLHRVAACE